MLLYDISVIRKFHPAKIPLSENYVRLGIHHPSIYCWVEFYVGGIFAGWNFRGWNFPGTDISAFMESWFINFILYFIFSINSVVFYEIFYNDVTAAAPCIIVWLQVLQNEIFINQTEKFSWFTLILYFSPIQYWRNCRKICQTVSDRPKIIEKFSQPADENGHTLLPGSQVE